MNDLLIFWKPGPGLALEPAAVARELVWGEDVEGLIDLPVKEIIERLKGEFPQHVEKPGLLVLELAGRKAEVTWSWQHVQLNAAGIDEDELARFERVLAEFACVAFRQRY